MMKINWIEFKNLDTGLEIQKTTFNEHLCLLVGKSGAGKSQILSAITQLCRIAMGESITITIEGAISFKIDEVEYTWKIKTSKQDKPELDFFDDFDNYSQTEKKIISFESLYKRTKDDTSEEKIFEVNTNNHGNSSVSIYGFERIPETSRNESFIFQFRNDTLLKNIYESLKHIEKPDYTLQIDKLVNSNKYNQIKKRYVEYGTQFSNKIDDLPAFVKFGIYQETNNEKLNTIKKQYKRIFDDIDDVKFENSEEFALAHCIKIKIHDRWIEQPNISSGMLKTLACLIDIDTLTNNYVVIIDEIENSLGVNCLDEVCAAIQYERNDLQFIVTSHHPYIINQIDISSWQIVKRKDNVISTVSAEEAGLLESHHAAYDKLQNLLKYGD